MTVTPFTRGMVLEREGQTRSCRHRAVLLKAKDRQAVCRGCGKLLDPFDVLLMYADRGRREARRAPDADDAEELVRELLDRRGRLTISRRGIVATLSVNGRKLSSQRQWSMTSLFYAIKDTIGSVLEKAKWADGREVATR